MRGLHWLALLLVLRPGIGFAAEPGADGPRGLDFSPVAAFGLTGGGETIARYRGIFLGDEIDLDVDAGGTFFVYGGASLSWPVHHVGLLIQGGIFDGGFSNFEQKADFHRWPIELIGFFDWNRFRVGLGATRHLSPKFEDEGIQNYSLDFRDASGSLIQLDYAVKRFTVGLRYVVIDYELDVPGGPTIDGDHWGIAGSYRFGASASPAR